MESINHTYDLKIKHEGRKVRRAIKHRLAAGDSDGGGGDGEQQQQQRGRERINTSGGEGAHDGSPVRGGVGSSGGQILSGIGNLASGLRLGTGAVGDAGSIVNPMVDLTSFINVVIGSGSHKDNIRKGKERKKDSVDLGPMIGIYGGKEKDGVVGGSVKLLWSGRVADIVRVREMEMDPSFSAGIGAGTNERDKEKERDKDRWRKRRLPERVASDGELDDMMGKEKGKKTYDGRSTGEESDNIRVSPGRSDSFGGMWSGRMKGKLGNWAGYYDPLFQIYYILMMGWCRLTRKKHQSVDLTTLASSRASPVTKPKEPSTSTNQTPNGPSRSLTRLVIGGGGNNSGGNNNGGAGSVSLQPSTSHGSGAQSPTLPPMCVVFFSP